ncbi:MAG TPA: hypothetical protein VMB76_02735 [Casimicrobiaceae bacterium]|nr:hypothetical protein [Casimicrobiaceae bacterium]
MAADRIDLARDCLDSRVLDPNGEVLGRADGLVLVDTGRGPPRVVAIEIGAVAQARRLSPRIGRWVASLARRFGRADADPWRVAWRDVRLQGGDCHVKIHAEAAPPRAWERFLRARLIGRIWGS